MLSIFPVEEFMKCVEMAIVDDFLDPSDVSYECCEHDRGIACGAAFDVLHMLQ